MNKILRIFFTAAITALIVINTFFLFAERLSFWTMVLIVCLVPVGFWIAQKIVDEFAAIIKKDK